jgi:signal transduction histidine kinase/ligand-binding sensor domain-containing protein
MKEKIFGVLLLLLHVFSTDCLGQTTDIKFNLVEGNNGEPLGQINAVTQDKHGYMWFSGQGAFRLYRYDGVRMISYKIDTPKTNLPFGNRLETVYADSSGNIWVGFFEGMGAYNPMTGVFKQFVHDSSDPGSLSAGMVSAFLRDHRGRLWVGTANGLDLLDEKTGKFIHYRNDPRNPSSLSSNVVRSIYEDRQDVLWVGTGFEFPFEIYKSPEDGGLNRMDSNGKFTRFMHDPKNPNSLISNKVRAIFEDSRGVFWIGTSGDGLHTMDRGKGIFERHTYDPDKPERLSRPPLKGDGIPDPITFIREDATGSIWIGTYNSGINRYDTATKKTTHYESSNGYPDKSCWAAYESHDGTFWLSSTDQGGFLFRVDPFVSRIKDISTGNLIRCIQEDKQGFVWASGFGTGLLQFDKNKNLVHQFKYDSKDSINLITESITSIFQNETDTLWLGTSHGIILFNKKTSHFNRLQYKANTDSRLVFFLGKEVLQIIQDRRGVKWFASSGGLFQYNPENQIGKEYRADEKDSTSIHFPKTTSVLEDVSGDIWVSSGDWRNVLDDNSNTTNEQLGIDRLDHLTGKFIHYLNGTNILRLYKDSDGNIWAGSVGKGVFRFNRERNLFYSFFDPQSEMSKENIIGITEDDFNNLWMVTKSSVVKLKADRKNYFIYGKKYGIRSNTLRFGGICKTSYGNILIGNNNGFYSLYPKEMNEINRSFPVVVTGLLINNQQFFSEGGSPFQNSIEETDRITLKNFQNNFSFHFAAMDFRTPEANKYYTSLENFDNVWRDAGGDKSATYINVPPGKYIFRVKAINIDGVKAEHAIQIIISPPWWKTWWAYSMYGLLLIVSLILTHKIQKQRTIRIERQKAQVKELVQAKEIERAYTELKTTQSQLIHAEKMASLGELTAGIAHEIQNPLNFVNNFSEVNSELIDEMQSELNSGNSHEAISISNDIKANQEKILQHGKRADAIVKGMLQHSRTSTGHKEPVDLNALANEYLLLSYHGIRARDKSFNVTMQKDFDEKIGEIDVIRQDVGRVLLNLYNNAFYSVSEKKKISPPDYDPVVSVKSKKEDNRIEISVSDNGGGISPKVLDKIFQPFFTTKPTGEGTGLGLSLSFDMIKAQGGEIKVKSEEGQGSIFTVSLPV